MPWAIKKLGGKFCVVNKDTGRKLGSHDSMEKAKKQLAALHMNVKK